MQQPHDPAAPGRARGRRKMPAAVYGAAIVIFLVVALFARGFSRQVGDARVAGRFSLLPLFHSRVPEELSLTWNGLTLHFGHSASPALEGFESEEGSTDIVFIGGARLRLTPGADTGGSLSLTPVAGAAGAGAAAVVPFSVEGVLESPPPGAALAWKRAGREFILTLPGGAQTDVSAGTLTLPLASAAAAVLQVQGVAAARPAMRAPAAAKLPQESSMPSDARLQASLAAWSDAAWQGLSGSRYVAAEGSWRLGDGTAGFSEDIGTALCAEAVARGAWQTAFPVWADALSRQHDKAAALTLTSSAYVGGERDFARAWRSRAAAMADQAGNAISRSDASILGTRDLVLLLVDHGTRDYVRALGTFLAGRAPASMDLGAALGYVQTGLDYQRLVGTDDSAAQRLREAVEKQILPAVRSVDTGVFLDKDSGRVDVRSSIDSGALLLRAGAAMKSTLVQAVGRGLVVSGLALADEKGFLPAFISLAGGRIASREGSLAPETVYSLLPLDRLVPRETPIAAQAGPGTWVWTSAKVTSATGSASALSLVFSYPRGVPYHLVVGGLRPFGLLKLHGIAWHSDPAYFKYSDGWDYDAQAGTLLMKITGRADQEEIDITF
jgi:hypothetical protein